MSRRDRRPESWSIGIYGGPSPFALAPVAGVSNPVLRRRHVSDFPAGLVADPFMIAGDGGYWMFFEATNQGTGLGEISLAASEDGLRWRYLRCVLREPFHLSFPHVFRWRGEYYMVPESYQADSIRLYHAREFPFRWSFVASLVGGSCVDPVVFRRDGRWWMFACTRPSDHDTLALFMADRLEGPWTEHPASPIVEGNRRIARPAGRVLQLGSRLFRLAQDCSTTYGRCVLAIEILELTPGGYREREHEGTPLLSPSAKGWNSGGMHHLDPHPTADGSWIACVDGRRPHRRQAAT